MKMPSNNKFKIWLVLVIFGIAGILIAIILIISFFTIRALLPKDTVADKLSQPKTYQETTSEESQANQSGTEATEQKVDIPTLEEAKSTVENFLQAFEDSDSKRMSNLLVGDAYNKFSGELDAIPYDHNVTEGKEFASGLFSFKVAQYFKGDDKGPYLEDWEYKVAKVDEGYMRIYERNYKFFTYFTPEN